MEADERKAISDLAVAAGSSTMKPLWTLDIEEITGHNIETRGNFYAFWPTLSAGGWNRAPTRPARSS